MENNIYILGAGGMAREVYGIYEALRKSGNIKGFVVNTKTSIPEILPKPCINESSLLADKSKKRLINGIGSPLRQRWIKKLDHVFRFESVIHPTAYCGRNVTIGIDVTIGAGSILTRDIMIGNHVLINTGVTIAHDCIISDFVSISPGVHIGGRTQIRFGTFIGIGTSVIQDITIGRNCLIGAGSVVIRDIPDNSLVYGNPATIIRTCRAIDWKTLF